MYDLIVVGTGFAGTFFLKKFLDKSKKDVKILVIERGKIIPFSERLSRINRYSNDYIDRITENSKSIINTTKEKPWVFDLNYGGCSNCWWGCTPRFLPSDFKLYSNYGIGQDWPLDYSELEPYYSEAEEIMQISGPERVPFPKSKPYPLPQHPFGTIDQIMHDFHGLNWISQPSARASKTIESRNQCCSNYSCSLCPTNAKFTIENGLGYIYEDPRIELLLEHQVLSLEIQNNIIKSVVCVNSNNSKEPKIYSSELFALASNAIFNAHILKNSGDNNKLTGAGLNEQKSFFINVKIGIDNLGSSSSISANGYMEYDGNFRTTEASCLLEHHNSTIIRNERNKWRKIMRLKAIFETIPDSNNKVKVSENKMFPEVNFIENSKYVENAKSRVIKNLPKILSPLGVEDINVEEFEKTEAHILSTVRMGNKPEESVVDKHQIHHTFRNLFVLGGSSFPTITASNPSLTISAISLYSAESLF